MIWLILLLIVLALFLVRKCSGMNYLGLQDSIMINGDEHLKAVIHAIFICEQPISFEVFKDRICEKFLRFERFRSIIVRRNWLWAYWAPEPKCDQQGKSIIDKHFRHIQLDEQTDHQQLQNIISNFVAQPLDPSISLWEFILLSNYKGGSVFVVRVHHALGDGISLMKVALDVLQVHNNQNNNANNNDNHNNNNLNSENGLSSLKFPSKKISSQKTSKPQKNILNILLDTLAAGLKLLLLPADAVSIWRSNTSLPPHCPISTSWTEKGLPLDQIKLIAKKANVTVNDILFCLLTGALRSYSVYRSNELGENADNLLKKLNSMQCVLWVSLKGLDPTQTGNDLQNQIGAIYLKLPIANQNLSDRLASVGKLTKNLSSSPEPFVSNFFMKIFGLLPMAIAVHVWKLIAFKVSISMSNLPGPSVALSMCSSKICQMNFFVPPQHLLGHFVTIISYNNQVYASIASDSRLVKDTDKIIQYFQLEFEQLQQLYA